MSKMIDTKGRPTLQQLKYWLKTRTLISFVTLESDNFNEAIVQKISPLREPGGKNYDYSLDINTLGHNGREDWTIYLNQIKSFSYPEIKRNLLISNEKHSKKDVILIHGSNAWHINPKLICERSLFFQNVINNPIPNQSFTLKNLKTNKLQIFINLDDFFTDKNQLDLLLSFLDFNDIDAFIHTPKDALLLLGVINNYPLQKKAVKLHRLENTIKDKFFELIADGEEYKHPDTSTPKIDVFLQQKQKELIKYCKRKYSLLSKLLLSYCSQIKNTDRLIISDEDKEFIQALRLLVFCEFKFSTLTTTGIPPSLFNATDLSSLPLHTLKMQPSPHSKDFFFVSSKQMKPLFKIMSTSTILKLIQLGFQDNDKKNNESNTGVSYIHQEVKKENEFLAAHNALPNATGFGFASEDIQTFNAIKPQFGLKLIYQEAAVHGLFNKYTDSLPVSRAIAGFLTSKDLAAVRLASPLVNQALNNVMEDETDRLAFLK
ncbi:MAG: hypothetical protein H2069_06495 [Legionella sp.]|nr:hypothetical protein [Legionella sp.]